MDQTSAESVKQMINRVSVTYGRIDVLMLNAGNDSKITIVNVVVTAAN